MYLEKIGGINGASLELIYDSLGDLISYTLE